MAHRITGDLAIVPDDADQEAMTVSGVVAVLKVCIDEQGRVDHLSILKTSNIPAYDDKLLAGVRTWMYRPFLLDGKAVPVWTSLTFIFRR